MWGDVQDMLLKQIVEYLLGITDYEKKIVYLHVYAHAHAHA